MRNTRSVGRTISQAADELAGNYCPYFRYSPAALRAILNVATSYLNTESPMVIDVGAGTGESSALLHKMLPKATLAAVDISFAMLSGGARTEDAAISKVAARAEKLPFKEASFELALAVCAIHLMNERIVLGEIFRTLRRGGLAAIIVHEPQDLQQGIFHRFFPAFAHLESARHRSIKEISRDAAQSGLTLIGKYREESSLEFTSAEEAIRFVAGRPFFGLRQLSDAEFTSGLDQFASALCSTFGEQAVIVSPSVITMGLYLKTP